MFENIIKKFKEKKNENNKMYDFSDDEKKLKKINIFDRIKFIKFNKSKSNVDMKKIKEVRITGNGSDFNRNRIYKFF